MALRATAGDAVGHVLVVVRGVAALAVPAVREIEQELERIALGTARDRALARHAAAAAAPPGRSARQVRSRIRPPSASHAARAAELAAVLVRGDVVEGRLEHVDGLPVRVLENRHPVGGAVAARACRWFAICAATSRWRTRPSSGCRRTRADASCPAGPDRRSGRRGRGGSPGSRRRTPRRGPARRAGPRRSGGALPQAAPVPGLQPDRDRHPASTRRCSPA